MIKNHDQLARELFLNSLLTAGENDAETARELLSTNGSDPDLIILKTLKNIKRFQSSLALRKTPAEHHNLLALIELQIDRLRHTVPEKVEHILELFFQKKHTAFSFKRKDKSTNHAFLGQMPDDDLLQLLHELEQAEL